MSSIFLYPKLSKNLYSKIVNSNEIKLKFSYKNNHDIIDLETENLNNHTLKLIDDYWDYREYGIIINLELPLNDLSLLFGKDGIVCSDTKVGVALEWSSSDSRQRGVKIITIINNKSSSQVGKISIDLSKHQFRNKLDLNIIFFIEEEGKPSPNEAHFANYKGVILGTFFYKTIQFEGIGSSFPIYTYNNKSDPLWILEYNVEDPFEDEFINNVKIYLNEAHKNYKYIDTSKAEYNSSLMSEIISSAMASLIFTLRNEDQKNYIDELNERTPDRGSVMQAVNYFSMQLGWDYSTIKTINQSIRTFFDKEIK